MRLDPFKARRFNKDTYIIEGRGCWNYLLLGEKKALLIDSGVLLFDLRAFVETLTDLPVMVVNTHGHGDHVTGNRFFDECYMHPRAVPTAKKFFESSEKLPAEWMGDWKCEPHMVEEGYVFDLGGREVEVIEIPCHSAGDIALLDHKDHLLFPGDNLEVGQILLFYGDGEVGATVAGHHAIMKKLEARQNEIEYILPGHNGAPLDPVYIRWTRENDELILNGREGTGELFSTSFRESFPLPIDRNFVRCSEYKGVSIIYDTRRIWTSKGPFEPY